MATKEAGQEKRTIEVRKGSKPKGEIDWDKVGTSAGGAAGHGGEVAGRSGYEYIECWRCGYVFVAWVSDYEYLYYHCPYCYAVNKVG